MEIYYSSNVLSYNKSLTDGMFTEILAPILTYTPKIISAIVCKWSLKY